MTRTKTGSIIGITSVIVNTILFGFKLWVGIVSGSVALIADAWHTLSDSVTSLVVVIGLIYSSKPADEQHPFGHGRAELIATIIVGTLLGVVGFNFIKESIEKLVNHEEPKFGLMALIVTISTIMIKEIMAQISIRKGKKYDIKSLVADGWHHRSDAFSSLLILIVIVLNRYIWWMDGAAGILVSAIILWVAFSIIRNASSSLLGTKPDSDFVEKITKTIEKHIIDTVNVHHIHLHEYGIHRELTAHVCVPGALCVTEAHAIASKVELELKKEYGLEATIHIEPMTID